MKNALRDAGLKPKDLHYINAHATSTPLGEENFHFSVAWKMRELIASLSPQSSPVVLLSNLSRSADVKMTSYLSKSLCLRPYLLKKKSFDFLILVYISSLKVSKEINRHAKVWNY